MSAVHHEYDVMSSGPGEHNGFGQPVGVSLPAWTSRPRPSDDAMIGRYGHLERLDPRTHAVSLHAHNTVDVDGRNWTYLGYGPFATEPEYESWAQAMAAGHDPQFWAVIDDGTGDAVGVASFLRVDSANGVIEVGHIHYSPALQRSRLATEAMYLMMRRVFGELGYRRYEWKCDALNAPSRRAATRLGFTYEGLFRQALVYKERNRDTAWYSIVDSEWPALDERFTAWLDPANFDDDGQQHRSLR